jgi:hypothetical protein
VPGCCVDWAGHMQFAEQVLYAAQAEAMRPEPPADVPDISSFAAEVAELRKRVEALEAKPPTAPARDVASTTAAATQVSVPELGYHRFGFGPARITSRSHDA